MWFFKKVVDVYYIFLFEWFEILFVSGIFNRMVIILIYLLQEKKKEVDKLFKIVRLKITNRMLMRM